MNLASEERAEEERAEEERVRSLPNQHFSPGRRATAWGVHVLTASGVICSLLAIEATFTDRWRAALAWLTVAVIIDAVDGTLARLVRVKTVLPHFDGALLDNLIDYVNYVIVPALIIHRSQLAPEAVSFFTAVAICLASAYQFCQNDAKTPDHFFKGFPSYWNIVALYLLSLGLGQTVNLAILTTLVLLVFVPIKYVYVTRTKEYRAITLPLTLLWSGLTLLMLWQLSDSPRWVIWGSLLYVAYYFLVSLQLTFASRTTH